MTKSWGYKILSERSFNFYLRKPLRIDIRQLARELDSFREISVQPNGSITIYTDSQWLMHSVGNIKNLAKRIDKN